MYANISKKKKSHFLPFLLRTHARTYQGKKNVILSEMFAHVLNGCFSTEAEAEKDTVLIM